MITTVDVPNQATFSVPLVADLWVKRYGGDKKKRDLVLRRLYRRIENGSIRAIRYGIGEPILIERDEVVRILSGDIE